MKRISLSLSPALYNNKCKAKKRRKKIKNHMIWWSSGYKTQKAPFAEICTTQRPNRPQIELSLFIRRKKKRRRNKAQKIKPRRYLRRGFWRITTVMQLNSDELNALPRPVLTFAERPPHVIGPLLAIRRPDEAAPLIALTVLQNTFLRERQSH